MLIPLIASNKPMILLLNLEKHRENSTHF